MRYLTTPSRGARLALSVLVFCSLPTGWIHAQNPIPAPTLFGTYPAALSAGYLDDVDVSSNRSGETLIVWREIISTVNLSFNIYAQRVRNGVDLDSTPITVSVGQPDTPSFRSGITPQAPQSVQLRVRCAINDQGLGLIAWDYVDPAGPGPVKIRARAIEFATGVLSAQTEMYGTSDLFDSALDFDLDVGPAVNDPTGGASKTFGVIAFAGKGFGYERGMIAMQVAHITPGPALSVFSTQVSQPVSTIPPSPQQLTRFGALLLPQVTYEDTGRVTIAWCKYGQGYTYPPLGTPASELFYVHMRQFDMTAAGLPTWRLIKPSLTATNGFPEHVVNGLFPLDQTLIRYRHPHLAASDDGNIALVRPLQIGGSAVLTYFVRDTASGDLAQHTTSTPGVVDVFGASMSNHGRLALITRVTQGATTWATLQRIQFSPFAAIVDTVSNTLAGTASVAASCSTGGTAWSHPGGTLIASSFGLHAALAVSDTGDADVVVLGSTTTSLRTHFDFNSMHLVVGTPTPSQSTFSIDLPGRSSEQFLILLSSMLYSPGSVALPDGRHYPLSFADPLTLLILDPTNPVMIPAGVLSGTETASVVLNVGPGANVSFFGTVLTSPDGLLTTSVATVKPFCIP